MMKYNLRQFLPLLILIGLTLYVSGRAGAEIAARDIPHAPDWDGTAPMLISDTGGPNVADRPYIDAAPNGNKLIIVYNRKMSVGNDKDPYFRRSTNGGQSWTSPAPIHTSLGEAFNSLQINLEIDASGTGHAVWAEADKTIMYSREPNWGNNSPTVIYTADVEASNPQIVAIGTSTLHLVWAATDFNLGLPQIWYKRSTNGGTSWSTNTQISPNAPEATRPHMTIDDQGNLHVVWEQTDPQDPLITYIYYTKGTVSGSSVNWSNAVPIGDVSEDPDGSGPIPAGRSARRPVILVADGRLHVGFTTFWQDASQWVYYVTCSSSCQNGQNWSDNTPVSGAVVGVNANSPKYIVSDIFSLSGCIQIYFHGIDDTLQSNELILGVNSCDGWFSVGRDVVTQPQVQSLHTSAVPTDDFIHMVYEQTGNQGTTRQIYYRRGLPPPFNLYLPFMAKG